MKVIVVRGTGEDINSNLISNAQTGIGNQVALPYPAEIMPICCPKR